MQTGCQFVDSFILPFLQSIVFSCWIDDMIDPDTGRWGGGLMLNNYDDFPPTYNNYTLYQLYYLFPEVFSV